MNYSISFIIFSIGVYGIIFSNRHCILLLISLELLILSIVFMFVISSCIFDDILGQIYVLVVLSIGAAETAIGLSILLNLYRFSGTIKIDLVEKLKG